MGFCGRPRKGDASQKTGGSKARQRREQYGGKDCTAEYAFFFLYPFSYGKAMQSAAVDLHFHPKDSVKNRKRDLRALLRRESSGESEDAR